MADEDWARLSLSDIEFERTGKGGGPRRAEDLRNPDPLMGARWRGSYREGFGTWGVGWGLQNSGGGPQGYGWGGGWQGGHNEIWRTGRFGGGLAGSPEVREPVSYAGRGPRGGGRSDQRIREDVSDRLMEDEWIDASDIEVLVERGVVTLQGTAPDRETKRRAERVVESCRGVREVDNRIRVASRRASS
ncbi:MAG TPA: BON domain-containing protein [Thermoanaerobaculia bacterium]|nr:BON domain-containing protein [Thermoanaerobaculia bacterium]